MPLNPVDLPSLGFAPTASDIIANHIREAIISGDFDEGEPIRQDDVAKLFDVSKIPVREALKRLEAEGLVEFQRNRGLSSKVFQSRKSRRFSKSGRCWSRAR